MNEKFSSKSFWIGILPLVVCLVISCYKQNQPEGDPYYSSKGSWDYHRIPLIKPLEVRSLNGVYSILVSGNTSVLVYDPRRIYVSTNAVFGEAGSQDITVDGKVYPAGNEGPFFALRAEGAKLTWFKSEAALRESSEGQSLGTNRMESVDKEFDRFQRTGVCKWKLGK